MLWCVRLNGEMVGILKGEKALGMRTRSAVATGRDESRARARARKGRIKIWVVTRPSLAGTD